MLGWALPELRASVLKIVVVYMDKGSPRSCLSCAWNQKRMLLNPHAICFLIVLYIAHSLEFHGQNSPMLYFLFYVGDMRLGASCKNLVMEVEIHWLRSASECIIVSLSDRPPGCPACPTLALPA